VTIPNSVTSIGYGTFHLSALHSATIGDGVTNIGDEAFSFTSMSNIYFSGNAPNADSSILFGSYTDTIIYYLPGTLGWDDFAANTGLPTALWLPQVLTGDGNFGVQSNQFGFTISWAGGQTVIVQAATNLSNPDWTPLATNTLTGGTSYFSDPQWTNYPSRFYRLISPN
jgi:hypothetical protein